MKLKLKAFLAALIGLCATAGAQITIIESTPQKLRFTWECSNLDTTSFLRDGTRMQSLHFTGSNTALGEDGDPVIPGKSLFVGVPLEGNVTVSFQPSETKQIHLPNSVASWIIPDGHLRQPAVSFADPWVATPVYSSLRSFRAAQVILRPVRYDASSRTVTMVLKGSGEITFPAASHRSSAPASTGEYEQMLQGLLANYAVATGWQQAAMPAKRVQYNFPLPENQKVVEFKIGDGHSGFNETTIAENGILKIPGTRVKSLLGATGMKKVALYASFKGQLPENRPIGIAFPNPLVEVPLLRVDRNGNGIIDDDDYFLAYVTGSSDWEYDSSVKMDYVFKDNQYDDYRTYWLTEKSTAGETMARFTSVSAASDTLDAFTNRIRYKQSMERQPNDPGSRFWFWKTLSNNRPWLEQQLELPGIDATKPGHIAMEDYSRSGATDVTLTVGGTPVCTSCAWNDSLIVNKWGDYLLRVELSKVSSDVDSKLEFEFFDVLYERKLEIDSKPTAITLIQPLDTKVATYRVTNSAAQQKAYLFRVTPDEQEITLVDTVTLGSGESYTWSDSVNPTVRYIICNESALLPMPDAVEPVEQFKGKYTVHDLRSIDHSTDYLIISHPDFIDAADSLASHKALIRGYHPIVVNVNDVYRYFTGGNKDPVAIRDFIVYVNRFWAQRVDLDYVLFVGLGHYDTKNYKSSAIDFIPVYLERKWNYEDFYTRVGTKANEIVAGPQMAIGRLPCSRNAQAWDMVKKIVETEDPRQSDFGEWRNRALFVADDDMQGLDTDNVVLSTPHQESSDRTAEVVAQQWPSMDIRKVNLYEYEWDQALQKPGASRALINEINNGVGYINFFGHGSDITWTDEYVLTIEKVGGLYNHKQYPIVSAFSCSVGKFDAPGRECLSGMLASVADVGAIAVISSSREAYANSNENLARNFYTMLFDTTQSRSVGTALLQAQLTTNDNGTRSYCILGDPSVRAVYAKRRVALELDDADDTLMALQEVNVRGSILKPDGTLDADFSKQGASVAIGLFNPSEIASRKDGGGADPSVRYQLPGKPVFLGKTAVTGGTFEQTILLPKNLTFNDSGVKLTAYAWKNQSADAATGYKTSIIFSGTDSRQRTSDTTGPVMSIRPAFDEEKLSTEASFTDHITSTMPLRCEVELFDESGIDAAGTGPDEGVTWEIENVFSRRNANSKFQFKNGDFRRGVLSVVLNDGDLKPGSYQLLLTARDLLGNLAKSRFTLSVTSYDELKLTRVFNFPNPMRMGKGTRFYCYTNYTSQQYYGTNLRLTIKIYSLSGKPLRILRDVRNGEFWDGRDEVGNLLSPDIYLYQVLAEDFSQNKTVKSKVMKLVVHPPQ